MGLVKELLSIRYYVESNETIEKLEYHNDGKDLWKVCIKDNFGITWFEFRTHELIDFLKKPRKSKRNF